MPGAIIRRQKSSCSCCYSIRDLEEEVEKLRRLVKLNTTWIKLINDASIPFNYKVIKTTTGDILAEGSLNPGQDVVVENIKPYTLRLIISVPGSEAYIDNPAGIISITDDWITTNLVPVYGEMCVTNSSSLPVEVEYFAKNYPAPQRVGLMPSKHTCFLLMYDGGWASIYVKANGKTYLVKKAGESTWAGYSYTVEVTDKDIIKALNLKKKPALLHVSGNCGTYAVYDGGVLSGKLRIYEWPLNSTVQNNMQVYDLSKCKNPVPINLAIKYFANTKGVVYKLVYGNATYVVKNGRILKA